MRRYETGQPGPRQAISISDAMMALTEIRRDFAPAYLALATVLGFGNDLRVALANLQVETDLNEILEDYQCSPRGVEEVES